MRGSLRADAGLASLSPFAAPCARVFPYDGIDAKP